MLTSNNVYFNRDEMWTFLDVGVYTSNSLTYVLSQTFQLTLRLLGLDIYKVLNLHSPGSRHVVIDFGSHMPLMPVVSN